jgi:5-(carboxyamino)imidazole ribonucleotide synthase
MAAASGPVVGVLGGGQLGMMLARAGDRLGVRVRCFDPDPLACARNACELVSAPWDDADAIEAFARGCDAVTIEFENVPAGCLELAGEIVPVYPNPGALRTAQDRALEKRCFAAGDLPVPRWEVVENEETLRSAAASLRFPVVLKTRRGGYDGRGQAVVREASMLPGAWEVLGRVPCVAEEFVAFTREVSLIAARGVAGEFAVYPLCQNEHRAGILRMTRAPAQGLGERTVERVRAMMERLRYVGVLAVEFFDVDGVLFANEMAPRVHNTGHWTIEGARTSQFENHLRAILGMPLGSAEAIGPSAMLNAIGAMPPAAELEALGAHPHAYGKADRPGRKVGHATVVWPGGLPDEPQLARLRSLIARHEQG